MSPPALSLPEPLPDLLPIRPLARPIRATVSLPGSKSITNRALILAVLGTGGTVLTNALFSRDTRIMVDALRALGYEIHADEAARTLTVHGTGGNIPRAQAALHVGNAGTAARFLTALLTLHPRGVYTLDGDPPMRVRPMRGLLAALGAQGAVATVPGTGAPAHHFPFVLRTRGLPGGALSMDAAASSQLLSALLHVAPYARDAPLAIHLPRPTVSQPFVQMTLRMMAQFGQTVPPRLLRPVSGISGAPVTYALPNSGPAPLPATYAIEPDATAASYFLALPVAAPVSLVLDGLPPGDSLQGDTAFAAILQQTGLSLRPTSTGWMTAPASGCARGGDYDFNAISDTFLTLAALAPLLDGPLTLRNLAHARRQETDRLAALATELHKLGQRTHPTPEGLCANPAHGDITIYPDPGKMRRLSASRPISIHTYDDHRIAMSFAILGTHDLHGDGRPWLAIHDPACCAKTFPNFFTTLHDLHP
ncbi:MAG: 3-phosphoshikimate 1-carboxyvinyltransferase [Puniceicoccales bacterium]|jgi:3-phosphoshikimate 1-carboxyvinyltransferase|nr:3-phosphoshikimate 1-carboxyvinyltransferase [Puniceicoccales bacterium]